MTESERPIGTEQSGSLQRFATKLMAYIPLFTRLDMKVQDVASSAAVALALRIVGMGLAFLFNVALARLVGAKGAGIYYQALAVVSFAVILSQLGLDNALLRFVAGHAVRQEWGAVRSVTRNSVIATTVTSIAVTTVVAVSAPLLADVFFSEPALVAPLRLLSLAILPLSLSALYGIMLRSIERIEASMLVVSVLIPLISLIVLVVLAGPLRVRGAAVAYVTGAAVTLSLAVAIWRRTTPQLKGLQGKFDNRLLLATAWPLFGAAILNSARAQVDIVLLGSFVDSTSVGVYGAAKRLAVLTTVLLGAVNIVIAPKFAALHAQGRQSELARLARNMTTMMTIISIPLLLPFLTVPGQILRLFGEEFSTGAYALRIIAVGQFVNLATGSVGYLLTMTGHEKAMRQTVFVAVIAKVLLSITLIPSLGIVGAAIATCVDLITLNVLAAVQVYRHLGVLLLPHPRR